MYYASWARGNLADGVTPLASLQWDTFTEVIDFSVNPSGGKLSATWINGDGTTGGVGWSSSAATALCKAARAHGRPALLCIGGASTAAAWLAELDTPAKRSAIAGEVADFMTDYGYSGVDLDGETAEQIGMTIYQGFWQAILAEFASRGWRTPESSAYKKVTLALGAVDVLFAKQAIADGCDRVSAMTYTPSDPGMSHHASPLSNPGWNPTTQYGKYFKGWTEYLHDWTTGESAIPAEKVRMGIGFGLTYWTGTTGPDQATATATAGDVDWAPINQPSGGITAPNATWYGAPSMMHGMVVGDSWYSFETYASLKAKAAWTRTNATAGVIVWMYQRGQLADGSHPLAETVKTVFPVDAASPPATPPPQSIARTNLWSNNPAFRTNTAGWSASINSSIARMTTDGPDTLPYLRLQMASATTNGYAQTTRMVDVKSNTTYHVSCWIRASTAQSTIIGTIWYQSDGGYIEYNNADVDATTTWTRVNRTLTTPANSASFTLQVQYMGTTTADTTIDVTGLLMEEVANGAFFDGSTAADSTHTYEWTDLPNNSTSIALLP